MRLDRPEAAGEGQVFGRAHLALPAEEDHQMFEEGLPDLVEGFRIEGLGELDAGALGAEGAGGGAGEVLDLLGIWQEVHPLRYRI